jgi:hypothetical protein|tara:strand:- start:560 stop:769 length:210 start_codon:yes stop_codon:yes gene_type:complete
MKIKEHLLDLTYAVQDVWEEAERMTQASNPNESIKDEMEHNVEFLLIQQNKPSTPAFKKIFEQVYKEEE